MRHLLVHKYLYLSLAILWTLGIAFLCLASFNELPTIKISGADKYVHFILHFGFTGLWFLYLEKQSGVIKRALVKSASASFVYGIVIEIAQELFTTTRQADWHDVLANSSGAIAAVFIIISYHSYFKKNYN
jgi:VanZ family protein